VRGFLRDLLIYISLHTVFISALALLGESRIDAYIAISILIYFISSSILPNIRRYTDLKTVDIALITIFIIIVILRILEILGYSIFGVKP